MVDYFTEQEYFIDRLWFYYQDSLYQGDGYMRWSPDTGFLITARVTRKQPLPKEQYIKVISFPEGFMLRMKLEDGSHAFAPSVRIDDWSLFLSQRISLKLHRLFFVETADEEKKSSNWSGSALIETRTDIALPNPVSIETRIGGLQPSRYISRSGIHYEDASGQTIIGHLRDKKHLYVNWSLPKSNWTRCKSWRFAEGLQDALSMVAGEVIQLCFHQSRRGRYTYTEIRAGYDTSSLGIIFRPFDKDIVDKDMLIKLAIFLAGNSKESDICRRIFQQMANAAQQSTSQASELLLATILEATLRSLYNRPFDPENNKRTDSFSLEGSLRIFRESHLSTSVENGRQWKKVIRTVIETQRRLRDRNAHPDWLSTPGGAYSPEVLKQTTSDEILLSRFYGYVILALAGFTDLQPTFPQYVGS